MAIQIIITGEHATDALAELQNLADALLPKVDYTKTNQGFDHLVDQQVQEEVRQMEMFAEAGSVPAEKLQPAVHMRPVNEEVKSLTVAQQKDAVKKMIERGQIDEPVFIRLSRANQAKVNTALAAQQMAKEDALSVEQVVEQLIADPVVTKERTRSELRGLVEKKMKNEKGIDDAERCEQIRGYIREALDDDGKEPMISNIPENKITFVYDKIAGM